MPRKSSNDYPPDWPAIARRVKDEADWRCVRCGHEHDPETGYTLTVHHLDINPANCAWWNLAALCQRCHLQIQHKVVLERQWLWEHSEWFKPYAAGFYAWTMGLPDDQHFVEANAQALLDLGQHRITLAEFYHRTDAQPQEA